jgi:hypothetical protein
MSDIEEEEEGERMKELIILNWEKLENVNEKFGNIIHRMVQKFYRRFF